MRIWIHANAAKATSMMANSTFVVLRSCRVCRATSCAIRTAVLLRGGGGGGGATGSAYASSRWNSTAGPLTPNPMTSPSLRSVSPVMREPFT